MFQHVLYGKDTMLRDVISIRMMRRKVTPLTNQANDIETIIVCFH